LIITKIQRLRGKKSRYTVLLDTAPALELSDWTIGKFGLRTGDDLDEQAIQKIQKIEDETRAKNLAVNFLSYRPRSSKEIVDHLVKKGFPQTCGDDVVQQLRSARLIDDRKFAELFVRDRIKRKPTGERLLRQQLMAKGILPQDADEIVQQLLSRKSQQDAAIEAAQKKMQLSRNSFKRLDVEKRKKRLLDFLLRRGFSYEIALKALRSTVG
jgi:regulatory protein